MELAFEVGGCALRWRFVGAGVLHATLSARPWEGDGGVIVANVPRDVEIERTLQGIAQVVRAYDAAGAVQLTVLADLPTDVAGVLHAAVSIARDVSGRRRLEALARALDQPRVWVLGFEENPGLLADGLAQVLEEVRKFVPPDRTLFLPFVVLGHRSRGRRGTDLSVGYPIDNPYGSPGTPEQRLWMVYLHWRIAWFAGGRPGWAEQLGQRLVGTLRMGNDETFECWLGDLAHESWDNQTPDRRAGVLRWLTAWPNADAATTRELVDADLLWHPAHDCERGLQPVPWIARALLQLRQLPQSRALLRGCDACEPLAAAALARCLQLEAILKARADATHRGITDAAAQRANPSLVTQRDSLRDRGLVPGTSAARADRLFDFAGLNDVLDFLPDATIRQLGVQLRDVRNALAHGHPPSWTLVATIAELWRKLAP